MAAIIAVGGCGGDSSGPGEVIVHPQPAVDARPVTPPDAIPKPHLLGAEIEWDAVIGPYDEDLRAAIMVPTGIVIVSRRDIYLADKNDGHVIATTPMPRDDFMNPGFYVGGIVAASGNLMMVVDTEINSSPPRNEASVYEYDKNDLSVVRVVDVADYETGSEAIVAAGLSTYLLATRRNPSEHRSYLILLSVGADGTGLTANFGFSENSFGLEGVATEDGHLLFCRIHGPERAMELVRIDPVQSTIATVVLGDGSEDFCRVVASPDRVLVYWYEGSVGWGHWDVLSRDGTTRMASYVAKGTSAFIAHTYTAGSFLSSRHHEIWAIDSHSGAALGRYQILIPLGAEQRGQEELVSDGANLYAAVVYGPPVGKGYIHLLKLAAFPTE